MTIKLRDRRHRLVALGLVLMVAAACGRVDEDAAADGPRAGDAEGPPVALERVRPRVVVLGDSIAAGLGLPPAQAFPAVLQERIDEAGYDFEVVHAGVSGDTSAGGLRRLDWALEGDVRILIVELGGNDGLRGLGVDQLKRNLGEIITRAEARGIDVLLCGMEAPPNLGPAYTAAFRRAFHELAAEHDVPLVPFVLDRVAGVAALNQPDGIHPNAEGARRVADNVWEALEPMLDAVAAS